MFEVKTIMTKDVITVYPETHIYDAMLLLIEKKISGLPVVDKANNLVGIISEKDMLNLLIEKDISGKESVNDYMTKQVKSFSPDDSAITVCEFFINNNVRRVPIADKGKLVGVVSRRDIIKLILKVRGKSARI